MAVAATDEGATTAETLRAIAPAAASTASAEATSKAMSSPSVCSWSCASAFAESMACQAVDASVNQRWLVRSAPAGCFGLERGRVEGGSG